MSCYFCKGELDQPSLLQDAPQWKPEAYIECTYCGHTYHGHCGWMHQRKLPLDEVPPMNFYEGNCIACLSELAEAYPKTFLSVKYNRERRAEEQYMLARMKSKEPLTYHPPFEATWKPLSDLGLGLTKSATKGAGGEEDITTCTRCSRAI